MEAKDTVIECTCEVEGLGCINCDYGAAFEQGCEAQAEISFKAGIREVVEWVAKYQWTEQGIDFYRFEKNGEWQAKLKEWGISNE